MFLNYFKPVLIVVYHNKLLTDYINYKIEFIDLSTFNLIDTFNLNHVRIGSIQAANRFNDFALAY